MAEPSAGPSRDIIPAHSLHPVVSIVAIVAVVYFGRDILIPLTFAVLLSFVLSPLVQLLRRLHAGRVPSVLIAVFLTFSLILAVSAIMARQVADFASELPRYETTLRQKLKDLRALPGGKVLENAGETLGKIGKELDEPQGAGPVADLRRSRSQSQPQPQTSDLDRPVPVEVRQPPPRAFETFQRIVATLLEPLATTGIVLVVVICVLLQREDIRDRVIRLLGTRDLERTTRAMNDAAGRLSRLYLAQTLANATFGAAIAAGLWVIGIPNPGLWGIMAGLLRFVPILGTLLAAALPTALAAAVDTGWTMVAATIAVFLCCDLVMGQFVEPRMRNKATGLSPLAGILAMVFWTWAWGPIGLLLATPLTVLLIVLGKHVESLDFLDVLLGSTPALAPSERFYHRLLAGDPDEVAHEAERQLEEIPLSTYFDNVAVPGLRLAEADVTRGRLDAARVETLRQSLDALLDDLADLPDPTPAAERPAEQSSGSGGDGKDVDVGFKAPGNQPAASEIADRVPLEWRTGAPVLIVGGRSVLDGAVAAMLSHLARVHGLSAEVMPPGDLASARLGQLELQRRKLVVITYLDGGRSHAHARFLVRRLRRRVPGLRILLCICMDDGALSSSVAGAPDEVATATSLSETLDRMLAEARKSDHLAVVQPVAELPTVA